MGKEKETSDLPTNPYIKKGEDDIMNSEQNTNGVTFSAGDHATVLHATEMFDLRKSELTPLAMRLAKDTATTVFLSEFRSKVIASKKKKEGKRTKLKSTMH